MERYNATKMIYPAGQTQPHLSFTIGKLNNKCMYKIKSGKYKDYEVCYTDGGQIFTREGYYLQKSTKSGTVKDILYLEEALNN